MIRDRFCQLTETAAVGLSVESAFQGDCERRSRDHGTRGVSSAGLASQVQPGPGAGHLPASRPAPPPAPLFVPVPVEEKSLSCIQMYSLVSFSKQQDGFARHSKCSLRKLPAATGGFVPEARPGQWSVHPSLATRPCPHPSRGAANVSNGHTFSLVLKHLKEKHRKTSESRITYTWFLVKLMAERHVLMPHKGD